MENTNGYEARMVELRKFTDRSICLIVEANLQKVWKIEELVLSKFLSTYMSISS